MDLSGNHVIDLKPCSCQFQETTCLQTQHMNMTESFAMSRVMALYRVEYRTPPINSTNSG